MKKGRAPGAALLAPEGNRGLIAEVKKLKLRRSVPSDHWAAPVEPVIDPQLDHLDVVLAGNRVACQGREHRPRERKGPTG